MKRILLPAIALLVAALLAWRGDGVLAPSSEPSRTSAEQGRATANVDNDTLARAIAERAHGVEVEGSGTVVKVLKDDREGTPHQRFLVRVDSGGTVLIAHNIELAPRVSPLAEGDRVAFRGDYEWNERGGVVHWTHPDPRGRHEAGWIRRETR